MAVTMEQVLAALNPDEPNYEQAAQGLGPDAIPFLLELVQGDDPGLAAKATSLAGHLGTSRSAEVLATAARRDDPVIRVVAAASLRRLPDVPQDLAESLLADDDAGVRRLALTSIEVARPAGLKDRVRTIAESDPETSLRDLASRVERQLP
jgi:hypothetical protein